jgi:hypothetical protein
MCSGSTPFNFTFGLGGVIDFSFFDAHARIAADGP